MYISKSVRSTIISAIEGDREAVRHIIIGSPLGVRRTIHQLHALRYEEAVRWTHPIAIPDDRIIYLFLGILSCYISRSLSLVKE